MSCAYAYADKFPTTECVNNAHVQQQVPDPCVNGGDCCDANDNLHASGFVCRLPDATNPCSAPATCDGVHPECQGDSFYADDSPCDGDAATLQNHGLCHSGVCSHIHAAWCTNMRVGISCTVPGHECVRTCAQPKAFSKGGCVSSKGCITSDYDRYKAFLDYNQWEDGSAYVRTN